MGDVVDLHEYFFVCPECDGFAWHIQWNTAQTDVIQIVCADCQAVFENPSFDDCLINFEPEFEID